MIILIVILGALIFFLFGAALPNVKGHTVYALCGLIILILGVGLFIAHDVNHYGMKENTSVTVKPLKSLNKKLNILTYKSLGNGQEKIYIYKTSVKQKKPLMTKADVNAKTFVKSDYTTPSLEIHTTRYVYKNQLSKVLFGVLNDNNKIKSWKYIFRINTNKWLLLDVNDAQKLSKILKDKKSILTQKVEKDVKTKLMSMMSKNPNISKSKLDQMQKEYIEEAQVKAIKEILK